MKNTHRKCGIAIISFAFLFVLTACSELPENEISTFTLKAEYVIWEMPWLTGQVQLEPEGITHVTIPASEYNRELHLALGTTTQLTTTRITSFANLNFEEHVDTNALVSLEMDIVNSTADVPFNPGERTVVTDGHSHIFVVDDHSVAEASGTTRSFHRDVWIWSFYPELPEYVEPDEWYRGRGAVGSSLGRVNIYVQAEYGDGVISIVDYMIGTDLAFSNTIVGGYGDSRIIIRLLNRRILNDRTEKVTVSAEFLGVIYSGDIGQGSGVIGLTISAML